MNARLSGVAIIVACALVAAPVANSVEAPPNPKQTAATTFGNSENLKTCRGKCYAAYEKYILGDPVPGGVAQHKKELRECYASCKTNK
jgi:hypothetical protein